MDRPVVADVGLADAAEMATRQDMVPPISRGVSWVKELDVKVLAYVDEGVGVPGLPLEVVGSHGVDSVVVVERIVAHETVPDALDRW